VSGSQIVLDFAAEKLNAKDRSNRDTLEKNVQFVKSELERSGIVVRETYVNHEDTLGPEWLPVLSVILSGPAVLLAIRAIRDTLKSYFENNGSITVTIKRDGQEIRLNADNINVLSADKIISSLGLQG
jgi:hypothetical protein